MMSKNPSAYKENKRIPREGTEIVQDSDLYTDENRKPSKYTNKMKKKFPDLYKENVKENADKSLAKKTR